MANVANSLRLGLIVSVRLSPALGSMALLLLISLVINNEETGAAMVLWYSLVSLIIALSKSSFELAFYKAVANKKNSGLVVARCFKYVIFLHAVAGIVWLGMSKALMPAEVMLGIVCSVLGSMLWILTSYANAKNVLYKWILASWGLAYLPCCIAVILGGCDSVLSLGLWLTGGNFAALLISTFFVIKHMSGDQQSNVELGRFWNGGFFLSGLLNQAAPWVLQSGVSLVYFDEKYLEFTILFRLIQLGGFMLLGLAFLGQRALASADLSSLSEGFEIYLKHLKLSAYIAAIFTAIVCVFGFLLVYWGYKNVGATPISVWSLVVVAFLSAVNMSIGPINIFMNLYGMINHVLWLRGLHTVLFILVVPFIAKPLIAIIFYSVTGTMTRLILLYAFKKEQSNESLIAKTT